MNTTDVTLSKDDIVERVQKRIEELDRMLEIIQDELHKSPKGNLRVVKCHGATQYHLVSDSANPNGVYLKKKQLKKAVAIAQRDYYRKVARELQNEMAALTQLLVVYHPERVEEAYINMIAGRRSLVKCVVQPESEFIAGWKALQFEKRAFDDDAPEFFAANGLRVRSKSEVIIADALTRAKVPFHYEAPLVLRSARREITLHPDFTCLNLRTRREVYWEHFGMMSDDLYMENALGKIQMYAANGFVLGKNFLATFESQTKPLSVKMVQQNIEEFLC